MRAYPMELRERVVAAHDRREGSKKQIAEPFGVSWSWVHMLLKRRRQSGSIAPKPHGGGQPPAFDEAAADRLRRAVELRPGATAEELRQTVGVDCSSAAFYRTLVRLGLSRGRLEQRKRRTGPLLSDSARP